MRSLMTPARASTTGRVGGRLVVVDISGEVDLDLVTVRVRAEFELPPA